MAHILSSSPCRVRRAVGLGSHPHNRLLRTLSHQTQCKCHHHLCLICNLLCTLHPAAHRKLNSQHRYQICSPKYTRISLHILESDHKLIISHIFTVVATDVQCFCADRMLCLTACVNIPGQWILFLLSWPPTSPWQGQLITADLGLYSKFFLSGSSSPLCSRDL